MFSSYPMPAKYFPHDPNVLMTAFEQQDEVGRFLTESTSNSLSTSDEARSWLTKCREIYLTSLRKDSNMVSMKFLLQKKQGVLITQKMHLTTHDVLCELAVELAYYIISRRLMISRHQFQQQFKWYVQASAALLYLFLLYLDIQTSIYIHIYFAPVIPIPSILLRLLSSLSEKFSSISANLLIHAVISIF